VDFGVDRIYWSFEGCTKETYEAIRIGADFDRVVYNLKVLLETKKYYRSPLPEVCFRYCFFKDNVHEVPLIPRFLYNLVDGDVKLYGDEPSINIVALLEFKETRGWECEIPQDVVDQVDKECKELGFKTYWSHVTHIEEEKAPLDYCVFWSEPYIMITGHVVPCCAVLMSNNRKELEELSFGNIQEQSLRDIWYSKKYKDFRKTVVNPRKPVPKVCMGCRAFNTAERARRYGVC
jgi:MoaA/NifB/PqqE/SkfB family radical SAM enzyme